VMTSQGNHDNHCLFSMIFFTYINGGYFHTKFEDLSRVMEGGASKFFFNF